MLKKVSYNLLSIIVILVVVMAGFKVLICSSFTMKWDMMNQFLPCRYFISECVSHHVFPLWCPYINFGYPFYADPQSGMFYPITWLIAVAIGYNVYTISLEYVLHVAIGGIAFFYLLRSFELDNYTATVFGTVYCLSGVFIGNAQHLPWIITMAWMPLILLNFKSVFEQGGWRSALSLALFLYLAITGGYPGFFIILFYFFLVYAVVKMFGSISATGFSSIRPQIFLLSLAVVVFSILALGYFYSFANALPFIARGKPVSLHEANNVALSPHSLISFFFPFATAATSFKLDTDISMANIYCGFLMLPLLFISIVKVRLQYFHKAIFAFAIICLLAATGKYFYVRTLLYNFFPGMDMLRHAAIFRVFTIFGLVFLSATGFNWLVNSLRNKTNASFIKRVFTTWFLLLALVFAYALFKNGFRVTLLPFFNTISVAGFNAQQSVYGHIVAQLVFQLILLLAFLVVLFVQSIQTKFRLILLSGLVIVEIFISAQLNLPATVISDIRPAEIQAKLDKMSRGFPIPPLNPVNTFTHYSDGSTLPIWYNLSFFKKIPAKDGFNSFYLQSVDDLNASVKLDSFLQKPVVFGNNPETKILLKKFEPNNIVIQSQSGSADLVHLQQNYYAGWKVFVDDKAQSLNHELCSMAVIVPAGNHTIHFDYDQKTVKYLFLLSVIAGVVLIGLLLVATVKSSFNHQ